MLLLFRPGEELQQFDWYSIITCTEINKGWSQLSRYEKYSVMWSIFLEGLYICSIFILYMISQDIFLVTFKPAFAQIIKSWSHIIQESILTLKVRQYYNQSSNI